LLFYREMHFLFDLKQWTHMTRIHFAIKTCSIKLWKATFMHMHVSQAIGQSNEIVSFIVKCLSAVLSDRGHNTRDSERIAQWVRKMARYKFRYEGLDQLQNFNVC
jgi:hypothetical protein